MKDFKVKGYFKGNQKESQKFPNSFDGYFLDRMNFSVSVENWKDIDKLIEFLKIHRPCFVTPGEAKEAYKTNQ